MVKYLIGSKLLNLNRAKSANYLVLSTEQDHTYDCIGGCLVCLRSHNDIEKFTKFNVEFNRQNIEKLIFNYQLDSSIIGQNFPIEYHLLDYKNKVIEMLKTIVDNRYLNFNKKVKIKGEYCSKKIYHVAYNTFIIQNNSPIITDEQRAIIQKIHDIQMPIEYLDELAQIIKSL